MERKTKRLSEEERQRELDTERERCDVEQRSLWWADDVSWDSCGLLGDAVPECFQLLSCWMLTTSVCRYIAEAPDITLSCLFCINTFSRYRCSSIQMMAHGHANYLSDSHRAYSTIYKNAVPAVLGSLKIERGQKLNFTCHLSFCPQFLVLFNLVHTVK